MKIFNEELILQDLPVGLATEVRLELFRDVVNRCVLFQDMAMVTCNQGRGVRKEVREKEGGNDRVLSFFREGAEGMEKKEGGMETEERLFLVCPYVCSHPLLSAEDTVEAESVHLSGYCTGMAGRILRIWTGRCTRFVPTCWRRPYTRTCCAKMRVDVALNTIGGG